jgi:hypothetical protein
MHRRCIVHSNRAGLLNFYVLFTKPEGFLMALSDKLDVPLAGP